MLAWGILTFCRIVTGFVFALSSVQKCRNFKGFTAAVAHFDLLPKALSWPVAIATLLAEVAVVVSMALSGIWLALGFVLASVLYVIFIAVLGSALRRRLSIDCHCFGASVSTIRVGDVYRNLGFLICSVYGCCATELTTVNQFVASITAWGVVGMAAIIFTLIWLQMGEIVQFLRIK